MLPTGEDGKFTITHDFVRDMIAYFKEGKSIPRRYVWEIVLGAHSYFEKEESLVNLDVEDGMTVDVIGDVHGRCFQSVFNSPFSPSCVTNLSLLSIRPVLRLPTPAVAYWGAKRDTLSAHER